MFKNIKKWARIMILTISFLPSNTPFYKKEMRKLLWQVGNTHCGAYMIENPSEILGILFAQNQNFIAMGAYTLNQEYYTWIATVEAGTFKIQPKSKLTDLLQTCMNPDSNFL